MKVMQIRSEFEDSGPGTQALTIARELRARGNDVIFVACGGTLQHEIEAAGFQFHVVPGFRVGERRLLNTMRATAHIARIIRQEKVDVVHAHNATSSQLAYFAGLKIGRRLPIVQSVRGVELRRLFKWRNLIFRLSPAKLLAVCEFTSRTLQEFGVPASQISITYNGINPTRFNPDTVDANAKRDEFCLHGKTVVGHIGAINGAKGQHILVEAVAKLKDRFPQIVAVLVGDGPERSFVERHALELGVADRIRFAGMRFESPSFHACFDVYSQPSVWGEMFPNAIVEAMAMRTPWIGSDISGLAELTADGQAGWVTAPGDVDALAANLARLVEDPELRRTRGERAYQEVHERFTIGRVVDCVAEAYDQVIADARSTRRAA